MQMREIVTRQIWNPICWLWNTCRHGMCTLIISGDGSGGGLLPLTSHPPPTPPHSSTTACTNPDWILHLLKTQSRKNEDSIWKNFNKDKLPLSLNQGMLIGAFIRGAAADNVTLAWGSYFAIKHLHSNDFIIAHAGCQRQTNRAANPLSLAGLFHSNRPANCISYQLIVLLSSWPSGKPGPTTMRCLLLEESVFNHFCPPLLFCLQCINKCFK